MIHVVCDCCKRIIDLDEEIRYVVRMEVFAAVDVDHPEAEEDRDYLQEIEEMLDRGGDVDESLLASDLYEQARFDLCEDCRQRFIRDPLGRSAAARLDFSDN
jgi:hypothetical protein